MLVQAILYTVNYIDYNGKAAVQYAAKYIAKNIHIPVTTAIAVIVLQ